MALPTFDFDTMQRRMLDHVDGRRIGNTPQTNIPLPAGRHTVTLINPDFNIRERVSVKDLKGWNYRKRGRPLKPGQELVIWNDPGFPRTVNCKKGKKPPALEILKRLPGTNCGRCGEMTCMAFALRVWAAEANESITESDFPLNRLAHSDSCN